MGEAGGGTLSEDAQGGTQIGTRYVNEAGQVTDDGPQRVDNPCVGNCLDVMLREFSVRHCSVTTIHDVTNTQNVLDGFHKDLRRARAAGAGASKRAVRGAGRAV